MEITHLSYSSLQEAKEDKPNNPFKVFTEGPDGKIDASIVGFAQDETDQLQILVENKDLWKDVFRLAKIAHTHYLYDLYGFDPLGMGPDNQDAPDFIKNYFKAFEPRMVEEGPKLLSNWDELEDYEPLNEQIYDCFSKGSQCTLQELKSLLVNIYNEGKSDGWMERDSCLETEILEDDEMEEDDSFEMEFKDFFLD